MKTVYRFGRTALFDYLTMIGKIGVFNIRPDKAYIAEATGPKRGARLLFDGSIAGNSRNRVLEEKSAILANLLGVGMQEIEDSLCNWQKNPGEYVIFRG